MPCPDLGALRASLDAPGDTAARDHVRACATCRDLLAELQRNAELAAPAIAMTAPAAPPSPAAVEAALARLERRRARLAEARAAAVPAPAGATSVAAANPPPGPADPAPPAPARPRRGRLAGMGARARGLAAAVVAAVVLTGLVATPGGRAAAASFLAQFRSQRFQVVSIDESQAGQLGQVLTALTDTGVFTTASNELLELEPPQPVRDPAEAERLAGFPVPVVDRSALPGGVEPTPARTLVSRARSVEVTFDRDRALDYLRRHGRPDLQVPERYDGTRLVVQVPAVVVQEYPGRDGGPRLLVGRAGTVSMDTEGGATLAELRELVLGLPGLPPEVVGQLRDIGDWRATLPLPVPADQVRWRAATVQGAEALSFVHPSGRLRALLWQRDGTIWGVAGVLDAEEAQHVADNLG